MRRIPRSHRAAAMLVAAALFGISCGETDRVSGLWLTWAKLTLVETETELGIDDRPAIQDADGIPVLDHYLKLAVGQYGREVGGVVRFLLDQTTEDPRCPCRVLHNGYVSGSTFRFVFEGCAPNEILRAEMRVIDADSDSDTWLRGTLWSENRRETLVRYTLTSGSRLLALPDAQVPDPVDLFSRTVEAEGVKAISESDKRCLPEDASPSGT